VFLALLETARDDPEVRRLVNAALAGKDHAEAIVALCFAPQPWPEAMRAIVDATRKNPAGWLDFTPRLARRIHPADGEWIRALTNCFGTGWAPREAAAETLAALRPTPATVLPALASAMTRPDFRTPCNLIVALGTNAAPLEPLVRPRTQHAIPMERVLAARALAAIHDRPGECVGTLLREIRVRGLVDPQATFTPADDAFVDPMLGWTDLTHREAAVWLLGELGTNATAAVPALREATTEPSGWMPVLASWNLWRITRDAGDALPGIAQALDSGTPWECHFALRAILEIGPAAAPLEVKIHDCARRDIRHRKAAAAALAAIGR
jgi:hypothetical protein